MRFYADSNGGSNSPRAFASQSDPRNGVETMRNREALAFGLLLCLQLVLLHETVLIA